MPRVRFSHTPPLFSVITLNKRPQIQGCVMILELLLAGALICECTQCEDTNSPPPPQPDYHESCPGPQSFSNGNLWKPRGENNGKLVVLLRAVYPLFDRCEVKLKNGGVEELSYTGLSNPTPEGDRYTFRGSQPGGPFYAGRKAGGGITCWIGPEVCEFPLPGPPKNRHD